MAQIRLHAARGMLFSPRSGGFDLFVTHGISMRPRSPIGTPYFLQVVNHPALDKKPPASLQLSNLLAFREVWDFQQNSLREARLQLLCKPLHGSGFDCSIMWEHFDEGFGQSRGSEEGWKRQREAPEPQTPQPSTRNLS